jgi:hypothetical protein
MSGRRETSVAKERLYFVISITDVNKLGTGNDDNDDDDD